MRIVVCIKQVPHPDGVRFNPKTKRVVREDVASITNPLDLLALGHALALRDAVGGEVTAVTMGPPGARACLQDAMLRGADRALHLTDRRFAGADTLATVRALARALDGQFDLILVGRSTLDGATAQIAPQLAELLGVAQVTQATRFTATPSGLAVEREGDEATETLDLVLPAVVSIQRGPAPPEPDPAAPGGPVTERTAEDLGGGPRDFGTRGSPTFVKDVRVLPEPVQTVVLHRLDDAVERLWRHIDAAREEAGPPAGTGAPADAVRTIWAVAERRRDGSLHPVSLEAIACARSASTAYGARVVAVLPCAQSGDTPSLLAAHGCDAVLVIEDERLARFSTAAFTAALCAAIERERPDAIIGPWTADGRDYLPRVAARLSLALTGDFVALEVADPGDDPDLLWIKPAWSGTVEAPIIGHTRPSMGTLRPGAVAALEARPGREVPIEVFRPTLGEEHADLAGDPNGAPVAPEERVDCAPIVVSLGADADPALIEAARRLAREIQGALAATAEAVTAGLLPPQCEVGLLRRSVSPRLFVALGHHTAEDLAAARRSGVVVTVGHRAPPPAHTRVDIAVQLEPGEVVDRLLAAARQAV
jgi:electron transfer flavoprotein alpha subunit